MKNRTKERGVLALGATLAVGAAMGGMTLLGVGTARADECPVTQWCGPVSKQELGDQDAGRYLATLQNVGVAMKDTEAGVRKLAYDVCTSRSRGYSSDSIITGIMRTPLTYQRAVVVVGYAEMIFCPEQWDMG